MSDDRGTATAAAARRAARIVGWSFAVSAIASIGLAVLYAMGGQPQLEGALIAVALGGLAVGFVVWGNRLMPQGPFVEERPTMVSSAEERGAFELDYERSEGAIRRRTFLGRMLAAALGGLAVALVFPIRSLGPGPGGSLFRTSWRRGSRLVTSDGTPVASTHLEVGGVATVFPEGHVGSADSQTILVRVDPAQLRPIRGRESWTPDGYVAYSKICTHAGCPVGLYEQQTNRLFCPCHQSVFDVLDAARPLGGPATRPLPQLPLTLDAAGYLRAAGDFPEPVGPGFWNDGGNDVWDRGRP